MQETVVLPERCFGVMETVKLIIMTWFGHIAGALLILFIFYPNERFYYLNFIENVIQSHPKLLVLNCDEYEFLTHPIYSPLRQDKLRVWSCSLLPHSWTDCTRTLLFPVKIWHKYRVYSNTECYRYLESEDRRNVKSYVLGWRTPGMEVASSWVHLLQQYLVPCSLNRHQVA